MEAPTDSLGLRAAAFQQPGHCWEFHLFAAPERMVANKSLRRFRNILALSCRDLRLLDEEILRIEMSFPLPKFRQGFFLVAAPSGA
jgi:hypothetical protein